MFCNPSTQYTTTSDYKKNGNVYVYLGRNKKLSYRLVRTRSIYIRMYSRELFPLILPEKVSIYTKLPTAQSANEKYKKAVTNSLFWTYYTQQVLIGLHVLVGHHAGCSRFIRSLGITERVYIIHVMGNFKVDTNNTARFLIIVYQIILHLICGYRHLYDQDYLVAL